MDDMRMSMAVLSMSAYHCKNVVWDAEAGHVSMITMMMTSYLCVY